MQFEVNITIDQTGVSNINSSGQTVTLVQSVVADPLATGNLPIAWLAFSPLEENQITWTADYSIYATTTQIQSGATIAMTSQTSGAAQLGWLYTFQNGIFTGAAGGGASTYNAQNSMSSTFGMGLAQAAVVNNVNTFAPLNVSTVMANESASFTPEVQLSIFLSSAINNGSVLSQVAGNAYSFTLSSQSPTINLGFNDTSNTFYPLSQSAAFARRLASASVR